MIYIQLGTCMTFTPISLHFTLSFHELPEGRDRCWCKSDPGISGSGGGEFWRRSYARCKNCGLFGRNSYFLIFQFGSYTKVFFVAIGSNIVGWILPVLVDIYSFFRILLTWWKKFGQGLFFLFLSHGSQRYELSEVVLLHGNFYVTGRYLVNWDEPIGVSWWFSTLGGRSSA